MSIDDAEWLNIKRSPKQMLARSERNYLNKAPLLYLGKEWLVLQSIELLQPFHNGNTPTLRWRHDLLGSLHEKWNLSTSCRCQPLLNTDSPPNEKEKAFATSVANNCESRLQELHDSREFQTVSLHSSSLVQYWYEQQIIGSMGRQVSIHFFFLKNSIHN